MDLINRARSVLHNEGPLVLLQKTIEFFIISKAIYYIGGFVPNRKGLVLFGAHRGESYRGNPRPLYEHFLKNESKIYPVWITKDDDVYEKLRSEDKPVVHSQSVRGLVTLARAQVGCFSHQVSDLSSIGGHSVPSSMKLIYTTHGCSVKGKPIEENPSYSNETRDKHVDYTLTTSKFQAKIKKQKTLLSNEQFLVTGYPRNDQLLGERDSSDFDEFEDIVLYAPTHRRHPELEMKFFPFDDFDINNLVDYIEKENILLLIRPHPDVTRGSHVGDEYESIRDQLQQLTDTTDHVQIASADKYADVNYLLSVADLLVTDYSSIFNDFLLLNRPIVFVPYDHKNFKRYKGLMYDYYEHIPGPAVGTQIEFIESLRVGLSNDPYQKKRLNKKDIIHEYSDDHSTERVVKLINKVALK